MLKKVTLERFSYDLEMESRKENRNNKRTEIERFHWFSERIQTRVTFGWLRERSCELSSNQWIFRFDVILQHDWPIEQRLFHIRVFFGGKTNNLVPSALFPGFGGGAKAREKRPGDEVAKTRSPCVLIFHPLANKTNNGHLPKPFFTVIRKSLHHDQCLLLHFCKRLNTLCLSRWY